MKNNLLSISLVLAITIGAFLSSKAQRDDRVPLSIEINNVALMKPGNLTQGLIIGETMEKAVQVLGQPTRITEEYFETDEVTAKVYHYKENQVFSIR